MKVVPSLLISTAISLLWLAALWFYAAVTIAFTIGTFFLVVILSICKARSESRGVRFRKGDAVSVNYNGMYANGRIVQRAIRKGMWVVSCEWPLNSKAVDLDGEPLNGERTYEVLDNRFLKPVASTGVSRTPKPSHVGM